jgi:hypothetical protein
MHDNHQWGPRVLVQLGREFVLYEAENPKVRREHVRILTKVDLCFTVNSQKKR